MFSLLAQYINKKKIKLISTHTQDNIFTVIMEQNPYSKDKYAEPEQEAVFQ